MTEQELDQLAESIKHLLFENAEVVSLSDDELYHRIEELVAQRAGQRYMSIQNRINAVQRTYQSIRGLGLLDELLRDESITEIMTSRQQVGPWKVSQQGPVEGSPGPLAAVQ